MISKSLEAMRKWWNSLEWIYISLLHLHSLHSLKVFYDRANQLCNLGNNIYLQLICFAKYITKDMNLLPRLCFLLFFDC